MAVVLLRECWLEKANKNVPTMFRYATHVKNNSLYNTPPTFTVYVLDLVLQWIEGLGGLDAMAVRNAGKAEVIYAPSTIAAASTAATPPPRPRSPMNVTFRLPSEPLEKQFVSEADCRRHGRPRRPPLRRRHPGIDLQRHDPRRV